MGKYYFPDTSENIYVYEVVEGQPLAQPHRDGIIAASRPALRWLPKNAEAGLIEWIEGADEPPEIAGSRIIQYFVESVLGGAAPAPYELHFVAAALQRWMLGGAALSMEGCFGVAGGRRGGRSAMRQLLEQQQKADHLAFVASFVLLGLSVRNAAEIAFYFMRDGLRMSAIGEAWLTPLGNGRANADERQMSSLEDNYRRQTDAERREALLRGRQFIGIFGVERFLEVLPYEQANILRRVLSRGGTSLFNP